MCSPESASTLVTCPGSTYDGEWYGRLPTPLDGSHVHADFLYTISVSSLVSIHL